MSEFDHIIMYLNVVEMKSFTAAAEKLGISANAVSKHVTQLEDELGLTLLSRSTRQLQVTEAGQMIYEKGKIAQKNLAEINEYARSSQFEPSGVLSIASSEGVGQHILSTHLPEFLQLYPKLSVRLNFSDEFPEFHSLDNGIVDVIYGFSEAMTPQKIAETDIVRKRINNVERIVCASPAYLARHGEPRKYEDLRNHYLIVHNKNPKNTLIRECEKRQIQLANILYVNNSNSILKLTQQGNGIAHIADVIIAADLACGTLKKILPDHHHPKIDVYLFYKKSRYLPLKIRKFIEFFSRWENSLVVGGQTIDAEAV